MLSATTSRSPEIDRNATSGPPVPSSIDRRPGRPDARCGSGLWTSPETVEPSTRIGPCGARRTSPETVETACGPLPSNRPSTVSEPLVVVAVSARMTAAVDMEVA